MEPVDCQVAFGSLPHGSQPILFKNHPDEGDPYGLPYEVGYGKSYAHETAHDLRKTECPFTGNLPQSPVAFDSKSQAQRPSDLTLCLLCLMRYET